MAKLLVTGGAGFIGSCFVLQALQRGDEVLVIDALTYAGNKKNLAPHLGKSKKLTFVKGNICNGEFVAKQLKKFKPDAVINFAAESHVDNSIAAPAEFIQTNFVGTYTMLESCRQYWNTLGGKKKKDFRYLQVSTDEVYGALGSKGKFTEKSPYQPNSPYSASKAAADHLARAWFHTYGLPTITTNCSNNYGPRQYPEKLIPVIIKSALTGKKIPVYGNGKNVRDWIHVEDHCNGIQLALKKGKPGETYLFGGHAEKQNIEIVRSICSILDELKPRRDKKSYSTQITFVTDRPGHDFRYAIDDKKAVKELGFKRNHNFASGLRNTVKWYLANC